MNALTFSVLFGQTLSFIGLAAGAALTFLADKPYFGHYEDRPNAPCLRPGSTCADESSPAAGGGLVRAAYVGRVGRRGLEYGNVVTNDGLDS